MPRPGNRRARNDTCTADRQTDQLVYQLYGLTAEEIAIVEAST